MVDTEFLHTSGAAKVLGLSPARVRELANAGELAVRWVDGVRLFPRDAIERKAIERAGRARRPRTERAAVDRG